MSKRNYVSNYDFTGDSRMHQLSLTRNTIVVVKQGQDISNGWIWGESQGGRGWFPVWAIDYRVDEVVQTRERSSPVMSHTSSIDREFEQRYEELRMNQPPVFTASDNGVSGFDTSANEIMGGHDPRQESSNAKEDENPFEGRDAHDKSSSSGKPKGLFSRFRKSKIIPFQQEKAKTPEWTPEPQIIFEGKVIHDFSQTKKKGFFQKIIQ